MTKLPPNVEISRSLGDDGRVTFRARIGLNAIVVMPLNEIEQAGVDLHDKVEARLVRGIMDEARKLLDGAEP